MNSLSATVKRFRGEHQWVKIRLNGLYILKHTTVRCHQTWRAGKWTIEINDFSIKTSVHRGFFSHV